MHDRHRESNRGWIFPTAFARDSPSSHAHRSPAGASSLRRSATSWFMITAARRSRERRQTAPRPHLHHPAPPGSFHISAVIEDGGWCGGWQRAATSCKVGDLRPANCAGQRPRALPREREQRGRRREERGRSKLAGIRTRAVERMVSAVQHRVLDDRARELVELAACRVAPNGTWALWRFSLGQHREHRRLKRLAMVQTRMPYCERSRAIKGHADHAALRRRVGRLADLARTRPPTRC